MFDLIVSMGFERFALELDYLDALPMTSVFSYFEGSSVYSGGEEIDFSMFEI